MLTSTGAEQRKNKTRVPWSWKCKVDPTKGGSSRKPDGTTLKWVNTYGGADLEHPGSPSDTLPGLLPYSLEFRSPSNQVCVFLSTLCFQRHFEKALLARQQLGEKYWGSLLSSCQSTVLVECQLNREKRNDDFIWVASKEKEPPVKYWAHFAGNSGRSTIEMKAENCIFQKAQYQMGKTSRSDVLSGSCGSGSVLFFSTSSCWKWNDFKHNFPLQGAFGND